jgi:hypothetical protein
MTIVQYFGFRQNHFRSFQLTIKKRDGQSAVPLGTPVFLRCYSSSAWFAVSVPALKVPRTFTAVLFNVMPA